MFSIVAKTRQNRAFSGLVFRLELSIFGSYFVKNLLNNHKMGESNKTLTYFGQKSGFEKWPQKVANATLWLGKNILHPVFCRIFH